MARARTSSGTPPSLPGPSTSNTLRFLVALGARLTRDHSPAVHPVLGIGRVQGIGDGDRQYPAVLRTSALRSDRRADQAIGITDRRTDQIDRYTGTSHSTAPTPMRRSPADLDFPRACVARECARGAADRRHAAVVWQHGPRSRPGIDDEVLLDLNIWLMEKRELR